MEMMFNHIQNTSFLFSIYIFNFIDLLFNPGMRRKLLVVLKIFVIHCFLLLSNLTLYAQNNANILYINSYHNGYYWSDEIERGLKSSISKHPEYTLFVEYLDSKHHQDYYKDPICIENIRHKYTPDQIKIITTSDNVALDFVLMNRQESIFKNKPIVASGISNVEDYLHIDDLFLVKEITTFKESFDLMCTLFPKINKTIFITDTLTSGQIYIDEVKELMQQYYTNIELEIWDCIDLDNLGSSVNALEENTGIFYSTVNIDCSGNAVNNFDIARLIADNAKVPVFSGYYASIDNRFVGGAMTTGIQNGETAADLVIELLNNKDYQPSKVSYPEVFKVLSYPALQRFNINKDLIPDNSMVLHKSESFIKRNKKVLTIGALIILQLLIVIGILYKSMYRQKKIEKQLVIAMNKVNEANKLKSIFLENISHELRTPLNSVVGFADLLVRSNLNTKEFRYAKIIKESANSLTRMINDVFDFSLLESYRVSISLSTFVLKDFLVELLNHHRIKEKINEKTLSMISDFDLSNEDFLITTDKPKLLQVLTHLLKNAIKFTQEGSITLRYRVKDKFIHFEVEDTGIGMTTYETDLVFEPFRQADERRTNTNRGVGLGLSISKSIIELLNGRIWVESTPKIGTTFHFILPVDPYSKHKSH